MRAETHGIVPVRDVAADIPGATGQVVDVGDHDAVRDAVETIETDATIEAPVNNAGLSRYFWIEDPEPDEWDDIVDTNLEARTGQQYQ